MADVIPPDNQALARALEMAGSNEELVQHIEEYYRDIANKSGAKEEYQPGLDAIAAQKTQAEMTSSTFNKVKNHLWFGLSYDNLKKLHPEYYNFQDVIAQNKLKEVDINFIADNMQGVSLVYDVNADSQFLRAYIRDGRQLDENDPDDKKVIDIFDQCFHSWLYNYKMSCQEGVIYDTSKIDRKNQELSERADPATVVQAIEDPINGLLAGVKKQHKGLELDVRSSPSSEAAAKPDSRSGA